MKKHHLLLVLAPILLTLSGCETYSVPRYSSSPNIEIALRALHNKYPNGAFTVSDFTSSAGKAGDCRLAGPVVTPDGESFSTYISTSLKDELELASMYKKTGGIAITGNVQKADFNSNSGTWIITGQINIGDQQPITVKESYDYRTSFGAVDACREAAQAYESAAQDFISKVIASPQFEAALKAT